MEHTTTGFTALVISTAVVANALAPTLGPWHTHLPGDTFMLGHALSLSLSLRRGCGGSLPLWQTFLGYYLAAMLGGTIAPIIVGRHPNWHHDIPVLVVYSLSWAAFFVTDALLHWVNRAPALNFFLEAIGIISCMYPLCFFVDKVAHDYYPATACATDPSEKLTELFSLLLPCLGGSVMWLSGGFVVLGFSLDTPKYQFTPSRIALGVPFTTIGLIGLWWYYWNAWVPRMPGWQKCYGVEGGESMEHDTAAAYVATWLMLAFVVLYMQPKQETQKHEKTE